MSYLGCRNVLPFLKGDRAKDQLRFWFFDALFRSDRDFMCTNLDMKRLFALTKVYGEVLKDSSLELIRLLTILGLACPLVFFIT